MTTFYDPRAERQVAAAVAEQHRADAEARHVETELRRIEVDAARAELAAKRQKAADASAAKRRRQQLADRAARRAAVGASLRAIRDRIRSAVPALVGAVAMGSPIVIGWDGQLQTARAVLHLGPLAWLFPVAMEGGAWWLAFLQHRAINRGLPVGRLRLWIWVLALLAAGMNFWRGTVAFGLVGGAGLALASLLGIGLWELTASHHRHASTGRSADAVTTGMLRWLRFPGLSLTALSIRVAHGAGADSETAWRAAWVDRYGVGPQATRRDRRLARLIVRHEARRDRTAANRGDLVIVSGVILRTLPTVSTSTQDDAGETPATPIELPKLSKLGERLMPKVRAAIEAGTLPETPSAKAINRRFGGGMETAIEVRQALRAESVTTIEREEVA